MLEYILCFIPQALVDKYQKFDGEAIEVLDSPPPSPRVAPATPVAKVRPSSDIMRSGEKVTPKRHLSFRRISNLVRKMTSPDPFDRSAWPAGVQGFYIGGRYYCKATRAPWSDEEVEEEPLDTSLLNGPILPVKKRKHLSKLLSKHLKNFNTQTLRNLKTRLWRSLRWLPQHPKLLNKLKRFRSPKFRRCRTDFTLKICFFQCAVFETNDIF